MMNAGTANSVTGETPGPSVNVKGAEDSDSDRDCPSGQEDTCFPPSQREILERCLHTLRHAENDSHTMAALLLITRLCPANRMDGETLRRVFDAVGLGLPARLLVTAMRTDAALGLPPEELLSLGAGLLAALSTDPGMAAHPQLLSTVPLLLRLLADGLSPAGPQAECRPKGRGPAGASSSQNLHGNQSGLARENSGTLVERPEESGQDQGLEGPGGSGETQSPACELSEAVATDCYLVLSAVCASAQGPEKLLSRGAVSALCRAVILKRTQSRHRGLPLLGHLISCVKPEAWSKYCLELSSLLARLATEFCEVSNQSRLEMCALIPQFLPPPGLGQNMEELKTIGSQLWNGLRPLVQAKVAPTPLGEILVLCACLLDLFGWGPVGPPKFCCLLVNRACVEVRMGLEELPGTELSPQQQNTLTGCYRIMEAAMEQACSSEVDSSPTQQRTPIAGLSLQQSRQVLGVLEEAFSAVIYYLQQVDQGRHGDPFVFATFRSLCAWLAEETSCLKEEVTALLPFLIGYIRGHLEAERQGEGLARWMSEMSVADGSKGVVWTGEDALRYLLPALCHLSAEEVPRQALLRLDVPALLVAFLVRVWQAMRSPRAKGKPRTRDPALETACSTLLNFVVTEPESVRQNPCFVALQSFLSDALPVLLHKPHLLVLAANLCTLGLMICRFTLIPAGSVDAVLRRFFSAALRFLSGALIKPATGPGPARFSTPWAESWEEAGQLWALGHQALGACVRTQPWVVALAREEGWLADTLGLLGSCSALPDPHAQGALEEALVAMAQQCPQCRADIAACVDNSAGGMVCSMQQLQLVL